MSQDCGVFVFASVLHSARTAALRARGSNRAACDIEAQFRLRHAAIVVRRLLHLHDRSIRRWRQRHEPRVRAKHHFFRIALIAHDMRGGNHSLQASRYVGRRARRRHVDHRLRGAQFRTARDRTARGERGRCAYDGRYNKHSMQSHGLRACARTMRAMANPRHFNTKSHTSQDVSGGHAGKRRKGYANSSAESRLACKCYHRPHCLARVMLFAVGP